MPKLSKNSITSGARKLYKRAKMNLPGDKSSKEGTSKEICTLDVSKEAKSFLDKVLGDVGKTSATKQIIIGTTSGWMTGFLTMKVGKVAAFAVGGGIIILQIAAHQGYIKVNWDKIQRKAEKLTDKVEEKVTGEGPRFIDKVERYVDKKLDKAEQLLKNGESRTRRWYHSITGDSSCFKATEFHFFLASFTVGLALGMATAK
ncbi:PREDICTED: FUN14 domain-containing protein 1 isoform X1 [Polistes dominula]|uniref:FUN14 domain-containing protein 1 isoform X1 n=2 Tax=Polistes dominula TaxID=743375 RepID=A0ABM1J637_POLDO|nr:PREDICTED: FUN14 domain-containing protein 1 isoform X1 [Polistes dominula]